MTRASAIFILVLCGTAACAPESPPEAVVVYLADDQGAALESQFVRFTKTTGIPVTTVRGDSARSTQSVIDNSGTPPADVLLTSNAADIWRAAEEGGLRPIAAAAINRMPASLRDADAYWAAVGVRHAVIGAWQDATLAAPDSYVGLARSEFRGKVCLSTSALRVNRSLIAMLIEDEGAKSAERTVRGWVRNLAVSPFATEEELAGALRAGVCHFGLLSSAVISPGVRRIMPSPVYVDIDGIGIARHARQPDSANALVDYMLSEISTRLPEATDGKNVGLLGWRDDDARRLAERAAYR